MIRTRTFDVDYEIIRRAPIARVLGRAIDAGDDRQLRSRGSFQPATPKDMQRLPEGQRMDATVALFTSCDLITGDAPSSRPDRVIPCGSVYNRVEFEIQSVEQWPSYRKYLAVKVGQ